MRDDDFKRLEKTVALLIDTLRRELVYEDREAAQERFQRADDTFMAHLKKRCQRAD